MTYERGQQLRKKWDGSIVKIKWIEPTHIVLDGDFEPNHVVMTYNIPKYYSTIEDGDSHE